MTEIHNIPKPSQYGKIWHYTVIAFGVFIAAAFLYWIGSTLARRPENGQTLQDNLATPEHMQASASHGANGRTIPTIN